MMPALRNYQAAQCSAVYQQARAGQGRAVICSPTGSGKSVVIAELCRVARRAMVISPSLVLLSQLRRNIGSWLGENIDLEQGDHRISKNSMFRSRITLASRNSLLSRERYTGQQFDDISAVVVDECHDGITPRMIEMLEHFESHGAYVIGLSATPFTAKGMPLPFWSRPCSSYGMLEGMQDGWLCRLRAKLSAVKSIDLSHVQTVAGDFSKSELGAVLNRERPVHEIVALVLETYARQPSVVYCASRLHAELVAEVLVRNGEDPAIVHSRQEPGERLEQMQKFTSGRAKIIVNVNVLSYGWDFPELRNVYNAAPTQSLVRYEQRVGRGTRPLPGVLNTSMSQDDRLAALAASAKPHFTVYDITDEANTPKIVNALDLIDAAEDKKGRRRKPRKPNDERPGGSEGQEASDGSVDIVEALERWERRQKLKVRAELELREREAFARPKPSARCWRMLWGPRQGQPLRELPADYLLWVLGATKKESPFKEAVRRELHSRKSTRDAVSSP
jgi:superfamily II DNA or RNA helicase